MDRVKSMILSTTNNNNNNEVDIVDDMDIKQEQHEIKHHQIKKIKKKNLNIHHMV